MTFDLPIPPSVNQLYFNRKRGGRAKTPAYSNWISVSNALLRQQRAKPVFVPVELEYLVSRKSRIDLGNHEKALTDLLVSYRILENDSKEYVHGISLKWADVPGVRVTIKPAEAA